MPRARGRVWIEVEEEEEEEEGLDLDLESEEEDEDDEEGGGVAHTSVNATAIGLQRPRSRASESLVSVNTSSALDWVKTLPARAARGREDSLSVHESTVSVRTRAQDQYGPNKVSITLTAVVEDRLRSKFLYCERS
jgi:hypothetical protein